MFDLLMVVLSLGLVPFWTWEMVRKQGFGGVVWLGLVWSTAEATETHSCGTMEGNRKRSMWEWSEWGAQKHTKWGPTSDTLKREASRRDMEGKWQRVSRWVLCCRLVLPCGPLTDYLSTQHIWGWLWTENSQVPSVPGGPWWGLSDFRLSLCVFLRDTEHSLQYLSWQNEHFWFYPMACLRSHQFYLCSVAIMVFLGNAWVSIWKF